MKSSRHTKHVLVIGAGVIGLTTAFALQQQHYRVTIVDPNLILNRATSAAACLIGGSAVIPWATGNLSVELIKMLLGRNSPANLAFPIPSSALSFFLRSRRAASQSVRTQSARGLAELGLSGLSNWQKLLETLPEANCLFAQTGCYFLYTNTRHKEADRPNCEIRKQFGMKLEEYSESELRVLLPELSRSGTTAVNVINAAHVLDPLRLQTILKRAIVNRGGRFIVGNVSNFEARSARVSRVIIQDGRKLETDFVVISAGYGSKKLASKLGENIPLLPCRGYSISLPNCTKSITTPLLVLNDGYAVAPAGQGLRIAGLVTIGGNPDKQRLRATKLLLSHATSLLGPLDTTDMAVSSGLRPLTPDSLPVISRSVPYGNAYYNFGHGHWGLTQAASSARLLTQLLESAHPSPNAEAFRCDRF